MAYVWAEEYPDLKEYCEKFNLIDFQLPDRIRYTYVESITQDGPQCGLVALAMCMKESNQTTVHNLLAEGRDKGFTYNGEMFSATDMVELAKCNLSTKVTLYKGYLETEEIQEFLFNGGLLLVPYDSDKNHAPCNSKGHKAHWALIVGIIEAQSKIHVIVRHGKSKYVAIWNLSELSKSNAQLEEFAPNRKLQNIKYKLPLNGIEGCNGLKCKSVCIWPL